MSKFVQICRLFAFIIIIKIVTLCDSTRITGEFRTDDFFKFIVKYGFQKTERHTQWDSYGYITINITI